MDPEKQIKDLEKQDLSGTDLLNMVYGRSNLLAYSQIHTCTRIEDILGDFGCCIILYQTASEFEGHWTCLFVSDLDPHHLLFFDSYGLQIDTELSRAEFNKSLHKGKIVPHLKILIDKSNYQVTSNRIPLQKDRENINTCGRYVATRINNRNMSNRQYVKFIKGGRGKVELKIPPYKYRDSDFNATLLSTRY
tara:strand:+ start:2290 stop:2865 length:576 start_codon:yes stop_codon:yes gene_type:complete